MMDKRLTVIYADAAEKFVKNVVLYNRGVDDDYALYYDAECTQVVNGKDLVNLCQKGFIVEYSIDSVVYQELALCWNIGPEQSSDNQELIGVNVSTWNCNFFNPIVEEEVESEEEAE